MKAAKMTRLLLGAVEPWATFDIQTDIALAIFKSGETTLVTFY